MKTDPAPDEPDPLAAEHDPYGGRLRERDFRLFLGGNFLWVLGFKMQGVAVGWEIFSRTDSTLALGLIGLVQILPVLALALIAGHIADRFDRRNIIMLSLAGTAIASTGLAIASLDRLPIWVTYLFVAMTGIARGFSQPARSSFLPKSCHAATLPTPLPGAPARSISPRSWVRRWADC